ncbi:MAG: LamG-like jellyroll fold domain-containing protein, partial [Ilumatobacteraceae bacterium]
MISEMASDITEAGGAGDVRLVPWPNGTPATLDADTETYGVWTPTTPPGYFKQSTERFDTSYLRGGNAADTACTTAGDCLTVWDHYDNCTTVTINLLRVVDQEEDGTAGIEPGIYLDRKDGNSFQQLWFSELNGGNQMDDGDQRGPDANGFPIVETVCGDASLSVFEIDGGSIGLDDYETFEYTTRSSDNKLNVNAGASYTFDETTSLSAATLSFTSLDYREAQTGINDCGLGSNLCNRVDIEVTIERRPHYRIGARRSTAADGDVTGTGSQFQLEAATGTTDSEDRNPSIAVWKTYGGEELFWVTWERIDPDDDSRKLMGQILNPDGSEWGGQGTIATLGDASTDAGAEIHTLDPRSDTFPATFWRDRGSSTIWRLVGLFSTNEVAVTDATTSVRRETFDVAYDPFTDRTVLVYEASDGSIKAKRFDGSSASASATVTVFGAGQNRQRPSVEFVPMTGEWLVTVDVLSGELQANAPIGEVDAKVLSAELAVGPERQVYPEVPDGAIVFAAAPYDSGLACPAWSSVPLVDVRFEELPGVSVFADSSRFGHDGVVSGGVAAGVRGAPGATTSDFAARFDSVSESVTVPNPTSDASTVAFWFRSERNVAGASFEVGSGLDGLPVSISSDGVVSYTNSNGVVFSQASDAADGGWHHIAVIRSVGIGGLADFVFVTVFVDGVFVASGVDSVAQVTASESIGVSGGASTVDVDHLRVYASAFTEAQVRELFERTDLSNCLSVTSTEPWFGSTDNTSLALARHSFDEVDPRGGRLDASARVGLVVDGDLPTS